MINAFRGFFLENQPKNNEEREIGEDNDVIKWIQVLRSNTPVEQPYYMLELLYLIEADRTVFVV